MDPAQAAGYESFEQQLMNKSMDYMTPQPPLSLIVQQSLTYDSIDGQNFPYKLWFLINNPAFSDVLHWSRDGTAIVFPDDKLFVQKVLKRKEGKIFKTESLKSFVRQLNLYGFRKVMCDRYEVLTRSRVGSMFDHECFLQGRPDLLEFVKRRCNVKMAQKDQEQDPTSNLPLVQTFEQNRNKRNSGLDFEDRVPKRRLRFSPQGKENELLLSPLNMLHRMQAPHTPLNESFINHQLSYLSYLQSELMYQNHMGQAELQEASTNFGLDDPSISSIRESESIIRQSGSNIRESGSINNESSSATNVSGCSIRGSGSVIHQSGSMIREPGSIIHESGSAANVSACAIRESGSVIHESGSMIRESCSTISDTGSVIRESGSVIPESGFAIRESGSKNRESGSTIHEPASTTCEPSAAVHESASTIQAQSLAKDDAQKPPATLPIVVTLPKSIMMPTISLASHADTDTKADAKMPIPGSLNAMHSPTTPSEFSLAAASYFATPSSLLSTTSGFNSPKVAGLCATTGPSPLSAFCASLFSPLNNPRDSQNSIHKATQTSGGPKGLTILAEGAAKIETENQMQNSALKNE